MIYTFLSFCVVYYLFYKLPIDIWIKKDRLRFAIFYGVSFLIYFILNIIITAILDDRMGKIFEQILTGSLIAVLIYLIRDLLNKPGGILQKKDGNKIGKEDIKYFYNGNKKILGICIICSFIITISALILLIFLHQILMFFLMIFISLGFDWYCIHSLSKHLKKKVR